MKSVLIYGFNSLETILKKLKFIKEIVIDSNVVINEKMIELFTKYCDDLNEIQIMNFREKCYLSFDSIDNSFNYLEEENEDLIDEAVD